MLNVQVCICTTALWPVHMASHQKRSNCFFPAVSNGFEHNSHCFHAGFSPFCPKTQGQTELLQFLWAKEKYAVSTQTYRAVLVQGHMSKIDQPARTSFVLLGNDIIDCSWTIKRMLNVMDCNTQINFLWEAQTLI